MENVAELSEELNTNTRLKAKLLYWQGWRVARISEYLGEKAVTVHTWKRRDKWEESTPVERISATLECQIVKLIVKENKEGKDFKELDLLMRQQERLARVSKYKETGKESDLNPNINARNDAPKKQPTKNDIGDENTKLLVDTFERNLFEYQRVWFAAGQKHSIRNILKSRQIGATWYFAREAVCDALITGKNKVFLSASKAQAHIFKNYIIDFVFKTTGVELKGDPLILPNKAALYFLGVNRNTAQGYHGDMYQDEYFWIHGFEEFQKVTSGMALHSKWNETYFSTPSSVNHEAYPFWTGQQFLTDSERRDKVKIDVSHAALKNGAVGVDGQWRQIVTVYDAIEGGCNLFDMNKAKRRYTTEQFNNLLMCEFIDDSRSMFPLSKMQGCMVDSWLVWRDFKPFSERPLAAGEVWIGYDPSGDSETGDGAGLVVVSPGNSTRPHRIIIAQKLIGLSYEAQAEEIRKICDSFNVSYIGMDITGLGEAVAQNVEKFFPRVTRFNYSPEVKARLVMQTQHIIDKNRLKFDAGRADIAQSFMGIRKAITKGGTQITYVARRSQATGHSELAWATMHALSNEPLTGPSEDGEGSFMELYE